MITIATVDRPVSYTMSNASPNDRVEPITLAMVKKHLRFLSNSEDDLIHGWIVAARQYFEEQTGRQLIDAVYEYALDRCPTYRQIELPRPPLVSVESVVYEDSGGATITLDSASYRVLGSSILEGSPPSGVTDPFCPCGSIELASGSSWPSVITQGRSVRIRRTCGYGPIPEAMPSLVQSVLYLLVAHFHRNRAEVTSDVTHMLPLGASDLIQSFKWTALSTLNPRVA